MMIRLTCGGHRGVAQPGSASALGAEGRRFESCLPDHFRVQRPTCDISMTEAADQPAGHRVSHQGRDMTILKRGAALLLFLVAACAAAPATPQPGVGPAAIEDVHARWWAEQRWRYASDAA